jgi:hypothetical protein
MLQWIIIFFRRSFGEPSEDESEKGGGYKPIIKFSLLFIFIGYALLYFSLKRQPCVFDYTHVPEDFTKKGYTEASIVKTVNHMKLRIQNYEPDIRPYEAAKRNVNLITKKIYLTNEEFETIGELAISGISIKALVVMTDKLFDFLNVPVNNYVAMEFFCNEKELSLTIQFKTKRKVFKSTLTENCETSFQWLCYQAALFILQETEPRALIAYYYNMEEYDQCVKACMAALPSIKNVELISEIHGYWALSLSRLDTNSIAEEEMKKNYDMRLQAAIANNPDNKDWRRLATMTPLSYPQRDSFLTRLISKDKHYYPHYQDKLINSIYASYYNSDTLQQSKKIKEDCQLILERIKDYPSDIFYHSGKLMEDWGKTSNKVWYDSAITQYHKALDRELEVGKSQKKISEYYNAIAYTFELKALNKIGVDPLGQSNCQLTTNQYNTMQLDLAKCFFYARQSVLANPQNQWGWSTLAEYYGLEYLAKKNDSTLDTFFTAIEHAFNNGLPVDDYVKALNIPYCLLTKERLTARYVKMMKAPKLTLEENNLKKLGVL